MPMLIFLFLNCSGKKNIAIFFFYSLPGQFRMHGLLIIFNILWVVELLRVVESSNAQRITSNLGRIKRYVLRVPITPPPPQPRWPIKDRAVGQWEIALAGPLHTDYRTAWVEYCSVNHTPKYEFYPPNTASQSGIR